MRPAVVFKGLLTVTALAVIGFVIDATFQPNRSAYRGQRE